VGLTQEQLATNINISRAYLSNIEKGKHTPSLEVAKKISDELNSTIEDIFFENTVR
jgi:putative transcriptional regulator